MVQKTVKAPFPSSQGTSERISGGTTGVDLIHILGLVQDAQNSLHLGDNVPPYAQEGTLWIRNLGGGNRELRLFVKASAPPVIGDTELLATYSTTNGNLKIANSFLPIGTENGNLITVNADGKIDTARLKTGIVSGSVVLVGDDNKLDSDLIPQINSTFTRQTTISDSDGYKGNISLINYSDTTMKINARDIEKIPPQIRKRFFGLIEEVVDLTNTDAKNIRLRGYFNAGGVSATVTNPTLKQFYTPTNTEIENKASVLGTISKLSTSGLTSGDYHNICIFGLADPTTLTADATTDNDLVGFCLEKDINPNGSFHNYIRWCYTIGRVEINITPGQGNEDATFDDSLAFFDFNNVSDVGPVKITNVVSPTSTQVGGAGFSLNLLQSRKLSDYEKIIVTYRFGTKDATTNWYPTLTTKVFLPYGETDTINRVVEKVSDTSLKIKGSGAEYTNIILYGIEKR